MWSERMTLMETTRDVADELSRPEGKYSPLQLLGKVWEARRETAAVFGDPSAGPAPPGIGGCAGTEEVLTAEGKKAQAERWLGDTGRLKERLARLESPPEEGSRKENKEAAVLTNKGIRAKGRFFNRGGS